MSAPFERRCTIFINYGRVRNNTEKTKRIFVSKDTVYLTRTKYRDRWRTQTVHDTIIRTDSIVQVIEHPPQKYVPKFYKWSTAIFWILIVLLLLCVLIRIRSGIK